ncbi:MAG: TIGR03435 family protein [Candidatus Sulfopaludibacter sp.]|nr:TIGR03435 family protein [Candidatus Sulfopaludibacter sp.]
MKLAALLLLCAGASAQSFDVASFTRIPPGTRHGGTTREVTPTSLTIRNATLGNSIFWAFGYENYRVVGPNWRDFPTDVVYNIAAKTGNPVSEAEIKQMFQNLLRARLSFAFHLEPRNLPVYALVVDRGGPKFQKSAPTGDQSMTSAGMYSTRFERVSMAQFVLTMDPPWTSRHVVDETGLTGLYDFTLNLAPFVLDPQTGKAILDARGAIDEESALIQALPRQLGLRLERKTAPLEVMVIDHAEKDPTAND